MRRTSALLAVMATAIALLCPAAANAEAYVDAEMRAVASLNQIRTSHGLGSLSVSSSLASSASAYSQYMLDNDFFGHQARIRVASRFRTVGETLAWHSGSRPGPRRTIRQWMASPPHRAVLMSSAFRQVGMGMERGSLNGRAATVWVAHFGRR